MGQRSCISSRHSLRFVVGRALDGKEGELNLLRKSKGPVVGEPWELGSKLEVHPGNVESGYLGVYRRSPP